MYLGLEVDRCRRGEGLSEWRGVRWLLVGLAGLLCFLAISAASAASVTASLDRETATVGEAVTLSVVIEGGQPQSAPALPALPKIQVQDAGNSRRMIYSDGQMTSSMTFSYVLIPQEAGVFPIPPIRVQVDGRTLSSSPLKLKVSPAGAPPASGTNTTDKAAFLQLLLPKSEVYLGEVLPVEIRLFFQNAQDIQMPQLKAEGFTVGPYAKPDQGRVRVGNQVYNLITFRTSVAGVKAGDLGLGPAQCSLNLRFAQARPRRPRDPFDSFFDNSMLDVFGSRVELRPATLVTESPTLRVLPLPTEGMPTNFTGAVGTFTLEVQAGPTNLAVGDPVTVKVRIAGQGKLDALALPPLDEGKLFKSYPPSSKTEPADPLGLSGTRTFEYVITPQSVDAKVLPPVQFSYFDPSKRAYATLRGPAVALTVRPTSMATAPGSAGGGSSSEKENAPVAPELLNIKTHLGTVVLPRPPLVEQPWFLALQGIPIAVWLGFLGRRKYREALQRNPRRRRQQQVSELIENGLKELRQLAESNEPEAFYASAFRLLQEQLGERLDLPASAITEAVLDEHLRPRGVSEDTLKLLHDVFQRCNQARYAPQQTSEGLFMQFPKIQAAIESLRKLAVLAVFLLLSTGSVLSENSAAAFEQANRLYAEGKFPEAVAAYQRLLDAGQVSPAVYFNLGNAAFKAGQLGRAIASYRLAQELAPRDADLRANLQFVRNRVAGPGNPSPARWRERLNGLTLNEWTWLTVGAFWLWFALLTARQAGLTSPARVKGYALTAALVTALSGTCLGIRGYSELAALPAVITVREATVKYGPLEESRNFYTLSDGAEVTVLEQQDHWLQVRDANQRTGWIKQEQAMVIGMKPGNP